MKHSLGQFRYCPKCGAERFVDNNEKSRRCEACGFVYYLNPSSAVACFIRNSLGELLLVRRANQPAKGTLDLPGGFVDLHESAEEAVRREVMEETGVAVSNARYLFSLPNIYSYSGFEVHTLDMFYECQVDSFSEAVAADDAASIEILPLDKVRADEFGLDSISRAVPIYLSNYLM